MKLLLTSGGVTNASIRDALVELLGKPIAESTALCIPTAQYGHPMVGPGVKAWQFISGNSPNPMVDLGWKSVGVLELTALPSIDREPWVPLVRQADALLVAGGDVLYLCHWMRESGLADLLASLSETVWVGLSAGSMVMTPAVGDDFIQWRPPAVTRPHWASWTSRSALTWLPTASQATRWPRPCNGRPACRTRRTRSTTRPRSGWSTATSTSSPKGTGSSSGREPRTATRSQTAQGHPARQAVIDRTRA